MNYPIEDNSDGKAMEAIPRAGSPVHYGRTVPDLICARPEGSLLGNQLRACSLSAAVGASFTARPGNRFWPDLARGGLHPEIVLLSSEGSMLLDLGYGITNVVDRATARADELAPEEFVEGGRRLEEKILRYSRRSSPSSGSPPIGRPTVGLAPRSGSSRRVDRRLGDPLGSPEPERPECPLSTGRSGQVVSEDVEEGGR